MLSDKETLALVKTPSAIQFVTDAYAHLKAIGHSEAAVPLLLKANVISDDGVTDLGPDFISAAMKRFWEREPKGV